jgi:hypothetical protein
LKFSEKKKKKKKGGKLNFKNQKKRKKKKERENVSAYKVKTVWRRRLFVCVRFVLHHTHTLRWKREITIRCRTAHHPSAATKKDSQGDGHRKKKETKRRKTTQAG